MLVKDSNYSDWIYVVKSVCTLFNPYNAEIVLYKPWKPEVSLI